MPYGFEPMQVKAGGDIRTCRFVKVSTAADNTVLEADANEAIIGISSQATQDAPTSGASANAAESGDQLHIHPIGTRCLLKIGSGGVTRGDEIKSDADGQGVTRATTGTTVQNVGAIALQSAIEGDLALVMVFRSSVRPALA